MTYFGASAVALLLTSTAALATCPAITVADMGNISAGDYPQQFELAEFQEAAGCEMTFSENPDIAVLNGEIQGNPDLPPLAERLPAEPLVIIPYTEVGRYGGTLDALSNATEAGTSDFLSVRHVNLVRYSDDLETIVPNIAKNWSWNDDFTELTITLRAGHKWSDGAPFTSEDVRFWLENLALDPEVIEKPKDYVLAGGEPIQIEVVDETTFKFILATPKPGLLVHFATSYAQPFQPAHFLGQFHPALAEDADEKAAAFGFDSGYALISFYYGNSDWTDTPSPMLRDPAKAAELPYGTQPTLESHIYVADTTEGRRLVANPYFHQIDPTGQQLPYISRQDEVYINDNEVRILKLVNAEVDYKSQSVQLPSAPLLLENQESGDYTIQLKPQIAMPLFSFNVTSDDEAKRAVFGDVSFRRAMSNAIDRDELNEVAFFGQGTPMAYTGFSPNPDYAAAFTTTGIAHDPDSAKAALDALGMADTDGDGFRELPNGDKLTLNMQFATQGVAGEVVEFVAQNWADIGIQTTVKEVTPDEYRAAQSANELDVGIWAQGTPVAIALGSSERFVPPYGSYFDHRVGMKWAEWMDSDGSAGLEPPQFAKDMASDIEAFQQAVPGSPEQAEIGTRIAENFAENMLFIGTVLAPAPIYHRNALVNVPEFQTWSYEYYRTYPYRATQWFLSDES
ncbi:ABC transporter substrate-binding protein [Actibacterium sp. 188UL27-1]|uniref:ABC transporter substrate-binding protein n=1 Tax=Actibacterium sp. 188UL27-1 TaxID=2786961 RepID=UPI0019583DF3|nr:ABC transporter substrate-binding protein [Actibacterium sp. 188UL27-1]MBM7066800.1 ABC transporter substrate-binding protein [Actibacterium sp. 188UL27-1]